MTFENKINRTFMTKFKNKETVGEMPWSRGKAEGSFMTVFKPMSRSLFLVYHSFGPKA